MAMTRFNCCRGSDCCGDDDGDDRGKQPDTGGTNDNRNKGQLAMSTIKRRTKFRPPPVRWTVGSTLPDRRTEHIYSLPIQVPEIPSDVLKEITNNFREDAHIGDGPYGKVYFGVLKNRKFAAIKKLKESNQPIDEFRAQVGIASALSHPNVTDLLGYCTNGNSRFLAYEFASFGTLHELLHGKSADATVLSWLQRLRIAAEAARGLEYLHELVQVVHRSIKSGNILLFDNFKAKIADFDLTNQSAHPVIPEQLTGNYSFPAPDFDDTGKFTSKSDVYSFGVVLLELLTGRKAVDLTLPAEQRNLVIWAKPLLGTSECIDPRMQRDYPPAAVRKFATVAACCIRYDPGRRPSMTTVRKNLEWLLQERISSSRRVTIGCTSSDSGSKPDTII